MQLGILICDHVNPKLKSEHGDYKKMFADLLKLTAPHVKTRFYFVIDGVLPNDINECDAYMTSGSK